MRHLDTCIVISYLNGSQTIAEKLKSHLPDVAISSIVLGELLYGARASARSSENLRSLRKFLQLVDIFDFNQKSADSYSRLRLSLRKKGRPSGEADMLIAAIAMANKATLVSDNTNHFKYIRE